MLDVEMLMSFNDYNINTTQLGKTGKVRKNNH